MIKSERFVFIISNNDTYDEMIIYAFTNEDEAIMMVFC